MSLELLSLAGVGLLAGLFGGMLGLGGGVFVVPILTLGLGIPIHIAIGTSIVSVVATSVAGASQYARARLTNIRLGILLETTTTLGGMSGALVAGLLSQRVLSGLFGAVLIYAGYSMFRRRIVEEASLPLSPEGGGGASLAATYYDRSSGRQVRYRVWRVPQGLMASLVAGGLSGLLGVGGGIIKVPIMNLMMGVPIKAAIATSNFMIGVTAVASAFIYYSRGDVHPLVAGPTVMGVLLGAWLGSGMAQRTESLMLRRIFTLVILTMALLMVLRAANISLL